jgi:hypothetical protein
MGTVEIRIWWAYDEHDPRRPWAYEVTYLDQTAEGRTTGVGEAWNTAYAIFMLPGTIVQDNNQHFH